MYTGCPKNWLNVNYLCLYLSFYEIPGLILQLLNLYYETLSVFGKPVKMKICKLERHWRPYISRCAFCDYPYTVIAKLETIDEDQKYISQLANVTFHKIGNIVFHKRKYFKLRWYDAVSLLSESSWSHRWKIWVKIRYLVTLKKRWVMDFEFFAWNPLKPSRTITSWLWQAF